MFLVGMLAMHVVIPRVAAAGEGPTAVMPAPHGEAPAVPASAFHRFSGAPCMIACANCAPGQLSVDKGA